MEKLRTYVGYAYTSDGMYRLSIVGRGTEDAFKWALAKITAKKIYRIDLREADITHPGRGE